MESRMAALALALKLNCSLVYSGGKWCDMEY